MRREAGAVQWEAGAVPREADAVRGESDAVRGESDAVRGESDAITADADPLAADASAAPGSLAMILVPAKRASVSAEWSRSPRGSTLVRGRLASA